MFDQHLPKLRRLSDVLFTLITEQTTMNFNRLTRELLTALRGPRRSRPGFSRHLGYRSNVAQRWETGECAPTATQFFAICERLRFDVNQRIAAFLRDEPAWLGRHPLSTPQGLSVLLQEMRGTTPIGSLASRMGHNRFSVARWFRGSAVPRVPELLALLEACSGRSLDFIGAFVDVATLPSARLRALRLHRARELAYRHPLAHAVLRALELEGRKTGAEAAFLALKVGIGVEDVQRYLGLLLDAGLIGKTRRGFAARGHAVVDTGADSSRARALKLSWVRVATERLDAGAPGFSGYRVFAVGKADLRRLHELQLAYAREMQTIIASSKRN
jgi:hypothetical protein